MNLLKCMGGYAQFESHGDTEDNQVHNKNWLNLNNEPDHRKKAFKCGFIQPTPSQILTVFLDQDNKLTFHIELDSGATFSYIREDIA